MNENSHKIVNNDKSGNFLRIQKDSWGNSGSNGGDVTLNMTKQSVKGNIEVDEISSLIMNLKTNNHLSNLALMSLMDNKNNNGKKTPSQRFKRRNSFCHNINDE